MNRERETRLTLQRRVGAFIDASEKGATPVESFDALAVGAKSKRSTKTVLGRRRARGAGAYGRETEGSRR